MLDELKITSPGSMVLRCDNKATIEIAKNPVHHYRTKHVKIDRYFIKEKIEERMLKLVYIPTNHQTTEIVTKALPRNSFENLKSKLGMIDIHSPA